MKTNNLIVDKSKIFAIRIVRLYQFLQSEKKEFVLSKQILRSGTSIGANIRESAYGQSDKDFRSKLKIALKEANETAYWLEIMHETDYLSTTEFNSIYDDCIELIKIMTSIVNTSLKNNCEN